MNKYPLLLSPLKIKNMILPNRVVMVPMGTNFAGEFGELNTEHIEYYSQRAKGGTGLVIVENTNVDYPLGSNGTTQLRMDHDRYIPALSKLVTSIQKYGAKASIQLNHAGASAFRGRIEGLHPVSSSDIPTKKGAGVPIPLSVGEIDGIVVKFAEAALRAKIAGFDSVEVHAGHSYLLAQFLSKHYNKRTDEYGGSEENRARFARRILAEIRKLCGDNFPIGIRVSAEDFIEDGNTLDDTMALIAYLNEYIDIYNVSAGINETLQYQIDMMTLEEGWRADHARKIKDRFGKATIAVGNIRTPAVAEALLEKGLCDLIGIGRGLIAEPKWVDKARRGQEHLLRRCVSCNIGCAGNRVFYDRPIKCSINPDVIYDEEYKKRHVTRPTNVVVIGGGVAGLETACTAAEVGCTTFLFEKNSYLGGLAEQISWIPDKRKIHHFIEYLEHRCDAIENLYVLKNTEASIDGMNVYKPDIIVNATGSVPLLPPIPGLRERVDDPNSNVMTIKRVMANIDAFRPVQGKRILVIGGGAVGMDMVELFAPQGNFITVIERLPQLAQDLDPLSRQAIFELMEKHAVTSHLSTTLMEIRDGSVLLSHADGTFELPYDYCLICLGMTSNNRHVEEMAEYYAEKGVEFLNIGDSSRPRKIIAACDEGRNILLVLDRLGRLN